MEITTANNNIKYGEGISFEKKEKVIKIGVKIQNKFFSFEIANEIEKQAIIEKITEWWSTKGVPIDG